MTSSGDGWAPSTAEALARGRIVGVTILSAVVYGVIHDQVTARICLEYFTIGHPPVFGDVQSPTLLGLGWGVIATWWVGLILGVPLALSARLGPWPRRSAAELVWPLAMTMAFVASCAAAAGGLGYLAALKGLDRIAKHSSLAQRLPAERHVGFLTDLWIHQTSYLVGFASGAVLIVLVLRGRYQAAARAIAADSPAQVSPGEAPTPWTQLPNWLRSPYQALANGSPALQLPLLFLGLLFSTASMAPSLGVRGVFMARLLGGAAALTCVALPVLLWRHASLLTRVFNVLLGIPALLVCLLAAIEWVLVLGRILG